MTKKGKVLEVTFTPEAKVDRPSQVRVFGRNYIVNYPASYTGMKELGNIDHHSMVINILDHQLSIEEADTVLHEVLHAIEYTMDLELSEHQIRTLATGLIGVFQDNPEFAKYITADKSNKV